MKRRAIAVAILIAAAGGLGLLRTGLQSWLASDGSGRPQPGLAVAPGRSTPPAHGPVRVVILDGQSAADSHQPGLEALCERGLDLTIDVGFPTKSLPVQAVLWTGLTAQQMGLGPSNRARTLVGALPHDVPDSLAVVQAWTVIARSMGFASVQPSAASDWANPGAATDAVAAWADRFPSAARAAVASDRRLVLIHVLAIDRAAHAGGRASPGYRQAVVDGDRFLTTLVAARPDATWLVLADHGHLPRGGHGDVESEVRLVRGCVSPRPTGLPAAGALHLVDLSRFVRDVLGRRPRFGAVGRPLTRALAAPDPDATLPKRSLLAVAVAIAVLLASMALAAAWSRPRWTCLWLPVAVAIDGAWRGVPSLSARDPRAAVLCAVLVALPAIVLARRDRVALLATVTPAIGATLAVAIAAGIPSALWLAEPPATPYLTALFELVAGSAAAVTWLAFAAGALSAHPDTSIRRR